MTQAKKKISNDFLDKLVNRFEEMEFFPPPENLIRRIIKRLENLSGKEYISDLSDSSEVLKAQQILIAEQFYLYMANISKKPRALNGESIKIKEIIDFNFDKAIGLSNEDEDKKILDEFAHEFILWLETQGREVNTGWGTINLVSEDTVTLNRFSANTEEEIDFLNTSKKSRVTFKSNKNQLNSQETFQARPHPETLEDLVEAKVVEVLTGFDIRNVLKILCKLLR